MHPGERALLQSIGLIALKYHKIRDFIKSVEDSESSMEGNKPGLYMRAFCNGLDSALEVYRNEVLRLEDMLLNNPPLNSSLILASMNKHVTLLNILQSLITAVQTQNLYGCLIMGKALKCDSSGVPSIIEATSR